MRRKSSAQNLLTSLKSVTQQSQQVTAVAASGGFAYTASIPTPTSAVPMSREWDVQSLHSDSVASSTLTNGSGSHGQGTSVEMLRETVKKRIITLTYLRNVHEGYVHAASAVSRANNQDPPQPESLVPYHHDYTGRA